MLTALGAALFAGAVYKEAAQRLCAASDLNPSDPEPYTFMGKIDIAAPDPLPCIEPRLKRFARQQPKNPLANYLYAMVLLKAQHQTGDPQAQQRAETLLKKAVTLDSGLADAWLQLGILAAARRDLSEAMEDYRKAIGANPKLGEAYYRLGVAYDRTGDPARARQEFELHDQIEKAQANEVERQRKEIQQFLIVPSGQAIPASKQ
jgi:Flp pilus assembly protein TadD